MENTNEQKMETQDETNSEKTTDTNLDVRKHEVDVLTEAQKVNAEMKKQNEIKAKLLEREEKLLARQETLRALGGGSPSGQTPTKPAEETPKEYAERIMKGKV